MAHYEEKNKALFLRRKGYSINEIAERLLVSKSVVSRWCRDIKLTEAQIEKLHQKMMVGSYKGRMKFLEKIRRERKERVLKMFQEGRKEVGKTSKREFFIAGIALYWAEGTKSLNAEETSFSNSDYRMILFMMKWFRDFFKIQAERFTLQIRINNIHKERLAEVEQYWSSITKIPPYQFTKTVFIKSVNRKVYPNNHHYGTVRLKVK